MAPSSLTSAHDKTEFRVRKILSFFVEFLRQVFGVAGSEKWRFLDTPSLKFNWEFGETTNW